MKRLAATALLLTAACIGKQETYDPNSTSATHTATTAAPAAVSYEQDIAQWREERMTRLKKEDSWLTLVGLHWLSEGANTLGSDKSNQVTLPASASADTGKLVLSKGAVTLEPAAGAALMIDGKPVTAPVRLLADADEKGPTVVTLGSIRFNVIKRAERYGLRVKDAESEARKNFNGIESFPTDSKWRVEARFEPYNPPKKIAITNIIGQTTDSPAPGAVVFTVDGKEYRIDPILEEGSDDLFLIFKDETSKKETYPAGRYLYAKMPGADGKVIVDFNKAYNPPCVFTPHATCPLPPLQNRLPIRIEAGEKMYKGSGHT